MDIHTFQKLKRRRRRKFRRSFSVSWCKLWLLVSRLDSVFQLDQIKHHLMDAPLRCIFLVSVIPIRTKSQIFKQTSFFPRQRIQHSQPPHVTVGPRRCGRSQRFLLSHSLHSRGEAGWMYISRLPALCDSVHSTPTFKCGRHGWARLHCRHRWLWMPGGRSVYYFII